MAMVCVRMLEDERAVLDDSQQAADPISGTVAFFGHDWAESTVIKRIRAFSSLGLRVIGFNFRREKFNQSFVPFWENHHLGITEDRAYGRRLLKLLTSIPLLIRHRARLQEATFFYARNIDMCALALLARGLARSSAPLVYEVLDVQRIFIGGSLKNIVFRWLERRLLNRCALLVVSSPGFVSQYFKPVQGYRGRVFLLENKISFAQAGAVERPPATQAALCRPVDQNRKWVIGWFGTLRCPKSLDILCRLAESLPDKVEVYMRGYPTETGLEYFEQAIAKHPNMIYDGEYRNPDDLAAIYDRVQLTWAFDFLDEGTNSKWLLPNRIYEGGYFGSVALAAKDTQTGEKLRELGLGYTFEAPTLENLTAFLKWYSWDEHAARRAHILSLPLQEFCDVYDTRDLCETIVGLAERRGDGLRRQHSGPALGARAEDSGGD
ncbi:glycosyltransferase family 4 protein [Pelagibius litoralis]|uniref:Glycosyltransferase family 4 protein n=1 Tax=Pelagibius litoralis TaxID=374515 RepID=A0A967C1Q2_9PROT|nr:glycosyltransferase family 4 protein [Pelagibius litoralis]NIA67636.1 glycosyltransferase family 4 protein [Pelagibius litoralis]